MQKKIQKYVIGVDGGGTKTMAALADSEGKILKLVKTGPSNLRNVGLQKAVENIALAIKKVSPKKGKILSIFIGLAAIEEEFKFEKEKIKREIRKKIKFRGKLEIGSDQIVAFRSGTDEKNGIVLISGTGCVCHGWRNGKEAKTSGWGWLNDEGSGFWVGQRGFQAIFKELDGRGEKTLIKKLVFKKWRLKKKDDFLKKVYGKDSIRQVSLISRIVDEAAKRGDRIARKIMEKAAKELVFSAKKVIEKLNFKNEEFPIVLIGRVFESEIVLKIVKKEIKKIAPKAKFLIPQIKIEPVVGAVKLAIENLKTC
jgi:N-acetylglucosamine kinase-like BadF-type ATPase